MGLEKEAKCVVWDLDNTIWDGILLESDMVYLKPGIKKVIQTLDSRGILQSIASKGIYETALEKLEEFNINEFFLYPEINWDRKSASIERIQKNLNIGIESIMFIDDQPFERDEVQHVYPEVSCLDASDYLTLLDHPRLNPRFLTKDSAKRRLMYLDDLKRKNEENEFTGPKIEFLESLNMKFIISEATKDDLQRAEELTQRTNQLNTTGISYSYNDLKNLIHSERHKLLIGELKDNYGSYGKIGLALIEIQESYWNLKLFLMSCRVMARGVGSAFLSFILNQAKISGKRVRADFKHTDRNRMMFITFKFNNFDVIKSDTDGTVILENDLSIIQGIPSFIQVDSDFL